MTSQSGLVSILRTMTGRCVLYAQGGALFHCYIPVLYLHRQDNITITQHAFPSIDGDVLPFIRDWSVTLTDVMEEELPADGTKFTALSPLPSSFRERHCSFPSTSNYCVRVYIYRCYTHSDAQLQQHLHSSLLSPHRVSSSTYLIVFVPQPIHPYVTSSSLQP